MFDSAVKIIGLSLFIPSLLYLSKSTLEQNPTIKGVTEVTQGGFNRTVKRLAEQSNFSAMISLLKACAYLCLMFAATIIVVRSFFINNSLFPYLAMAFIVTLICALSLAWVLFHRDMAPRFFIPILGVVVLMAFPGPHQDFVHHQLGHVCQNNSNLPPLCNKLQAYSPSLLFVVVAIVSAVVLYLAMSFLSVIVAAITFFAVDILLSAAELMHEKFPKNSFGPFMVMMQIVSAVLLAM